MIRKLLLTFAVGIVILISATQKIEKEESLSSPEDRAWARALRLSDAQYITDYRPNIEWEQDWIFLDDGSQLLGLYVFQGIIEKGELTIPKAKIDIYLSPDMYLVAPTVSEDLMVHEYLHHFYYFRAFNEEYFYRENPDSHIWIDSKHQSMVPWHE